MNIHTFLRSTRKGNMYFSIYQSTLSFNYYLLNEVGEIKLSIKLGTYRVRNSSNYEAIEKLITSIPDIYKEMQKVVDNPSVSLKTVTCEYGHTHQIKVTTYPLLATLQTKYRNLININEVPTSKFIVHLPHTSSELYNWNGSEVWAPDEDNKFKWHNVWCITPKEL